MPKYEPYIRTKRALTNENMFGLCTNGENIQHDLCSFQRNIEINLISLVLLCFAVLFVFSRAGFYC